MTNTAAAVAFKRDGTGAFEEIAPGAPSWNYRVQKHGGANNTGVRYKDVRAEMQRNIGSCEEPAVVTIRNRKLNGRTTQLSHIIAEIQGAEPLITEFHFMACRENLAGRRESPLDPAPVQNPPLPPADAQIA
jgi:hypothetical protein